MALFDWSLTWQDTTVGLVIGGIFGWGYARVKREES